jgi:hypothetical protein
MTKKWKKFTAEILLLSKTTIYLFLGRQKGFQATEEAFSPQKRISSTQSIKFLNFFPTFVQCGGSGMFIPDPGS